MRISHAWQWPIVILSALAGIAHIMGEVVPHWDPSLALNQYPQFLPWIMGVFLILGAGLTAHSLYKKVGIQTRWRYEHAGLSLLAPVWALQGISGALVDFERIIPWMAYLAIGIGCYIRSRQAKRSREKAYEDPTNLKVIQ